MPTFANKVIYASTFFVCALSGAQANAADLLHPLFSSNAVLQRDREVPIWGEAPPNTKVEVLLGKQKTTAISNRSGEWQAKIKPHSASTGHKLVVSTPTETQTRENIAFGDVWICGGQSNMEWRLFSGNPRPVNDAVAEAKNANFPDIRLLTVPHVSALTPQKNLKAKWSVCDPETVKGISAVGYFFGRELNKRTGVPIGLIDSTWGGTAAQVWASGESLDKFPDFQKGLEAVRKTRTDVPFLTQYEEFLKANETGTREGWARPDLDDTDWKTTELPALWEATSTTGLRGFDGSAWYRRDIELDEATAKSGDLTIKLGVVDDFDVTYWNGEKIGMSSNRFGSRQYKVPAALLKAGKNVLSVQVMDISGDSGFRDNAAAMQMVDSTGKSTPLSGTWKLKISNNLNDIPPVPVDTTAYPSYPGLLYNAMISPLTPYGVKGAIWYQGESNAGRPAQYETLLPALIADWRRSFQSGDFPFYIVQLAGFMNRDTKPAESMNNWPRFRESQEKIAKSVKNSGLAITTDIGEEKDVHPRNKVDVGRRLAALALKNDYGLYVATEGPIFKSARRNGNKLVVELSNTGGNLKQTGEMDKAFVVAGDDKKWAWAKIDSVENIGDVARVTLSAPEVAQPVAVRFAWSNFPIGHLYNAAGLPAAPFRSDKW